MSGLSENLSLTVSKLTGLQQQEHFLFSASVGSLSTLFSYLTGGTSLFNVDLSQNFNLTLIENNKELASLELDLKTLQEDPNTLKEKIFILTPLEDSKEDQQKKEEITVELSLSLFTPSTDNEQCQQLENQLAEIQNELKHLEQTEKASMARQASLEKIDEEAQTLRIQLEKSLTERDELENSCLENKEKFDSHFTEQSKRLDETYNKLSSATQEIQVLKSKNMALEVSEKEKRGEIQKLVMENDQLESSNSCLNEEVKLNSTVREELDDAWNENENLNRKFRESIEEFSNSSAEENSCIEKLRLEKEEEQKKIEELLAELHSSRSESDEFKAENIWLRSEIAKLKAFESLYLALQAKEIELKAVLAQTEEANKNLKEEIAREQKESEKQMEKLKSLLEEALAENKELSENKEKLEEKYSELEMEFEIVSKSLEDKEAENLSLKQEIAVIADMKSIIEALKQQTNLLQTQNSEMNQSIKELSEKIESQSEDLLKLNNTIFTLEQKNSLQSKINQELSSEKNFLTNELTLTQSELSENNNKLNSLENTVKAHEMNFQDLMNKYADLQKRKLYVPVKDDPIDIALADFVNTREKSLAVDFTREDIGVYYFGTKRLFVKLEKGKVIIRVGGGFMEIENFLEMYSENELDKFSNKQRTKAENVRKSLYGKYANSLVTEGREISKKRRSVKHNDFNTYYAIERKSTISPRRSNSPVKSGSRSKLEA